MKYDVVVVGGGAAGFFAAINIKKLKPNTQVLIIEKTNKLLSKVKISGGGRCNVTHYCLNPFELTKYYPRGQKFLKSIFSQFAVPETIAWFKSEGIELKTESDNRMFPVSNSSETIVNCLLELAYKLDIQILSQTEILNINYQSTEISIELNNLEILKTSYLLCGSGGVNVQNKISYLNSLDLNWIPSVPSLFTFNIPKHPLLELSGVSIPNGKIKVVGDKSVFEGPILITHWGLSGPAILKSSAWLARKLSEMNYNFDILVSWTQSDSEESFKQKLYDAINGNNQKKIVNENFLGLPSRLWNMILEMAKISENKICSELSNHEKNKLIELIIKMPLNVSGKTTFKEEFVTAGGLDLAEVNPLDCSSKKYPHIHFCGEVLDIDGVTGGFNFQAAWSTAYISAVGISKAL
jgi:predicted Rossmann fold flavoprotein